jgi:ABC-type phosphate transport system ATPase subunit
MVPLSAKQVSAIVGDSGCGLIILRCIKVSSDSCFIQSPEFNLQVAVNEGKLKLEL